MTETAGQRIRRRRLALGYTNQGQFAKIVGMAQSTLSEIERGESKLPSAKNLKRLCEVLQVTDNWIIYGHEGELQYPTEAETKALNLIRQMTAEQQRAVYAFIAAFAGKGDLPGG